MSRFAELLPQLWTDENQENTVRYFMRSDLTREEAVLLYESVRESSQALLAQLGRSVDAMSAREGMQLIALTDMARYGQAALEHVMTLALRMTLFEFAAEGKAHSTPGCDCTICQLAHEINSSLAIAEKAPRFNRG